MGRPEGPSGGFGAWWGVARGGVVRRGLANRAPRSPPLGFLGAEKRRGVVSGRTLTMGDLDVQLDEEGGRRIVRVAPVWRGTTRWKVRPPTHLQPFSCATPLSAWWRRPPSSPRPKSASAPPDIPTGPFANPPGRCCAVGWRTRAPTCSLFSDFLSVLAPKMAEFRAARPAS